MTVFKETLSTRVPQPELEKAELENFYHLLYNQQYYQNIRDSHERQLNILELQHGVTQCRTCAAPSNGLPILGNAPEWALPISYMPWDYSQESLLVRKELQELYNLYGQKKVNPIEEVDHNKELTSNFYKLLQPTYNYLSLNPDILSKILPESIPLVTETPTKAQSVSSHSPSPRKDFEKEHSPSISNHLKSRDHSHEGTNAKVSDSKERVNDHYFNPFTYSAINLHTPHNNSKDEGKTRKLKLTSHENTISQADELFNNCLNLPFVNKESFGGKDLGDGNTSRYSDHSTLDNYCHSKYNELCYGLLKQSDLEGSAVNNYSNYLQGLGNTNCKASKSNVKLSNNSHLKHEDSQHFDKYSGTNEEHARFKKEHFVDERINKTENSSVVNVPKLTPGVWEDTEMSGQYPGHSRPPVGTPPPQTVWNHLTMTQGQGLNIHPTALSGATLNPAGFYTHPSMARASHLTSQLTPQLAHTQAPPTWHTPTVPSKTVTQTSTPGNPLFSLQMLVDNRQNQSQYRNSPSAQSTLDLSATSEMAENYSRLPQDIPISLTARNVDKGSRNGNIISPPIPLNGETSSDSGISSSVPTPNSVSEPVSLSTKEITTPKISVKNFESNLKGVANLHDKIKEISGDNFNQKVINLPPSVTIERVTEKKETEPVVKSKDSLSVIAQVPRNVLPVIVNLTSKIDKDVTDSPKREPSLERDKKIEETNVRSPKNVPKRGKKGVDSLLEKLEGGTKKLGSQENIGSVIVMPVEESKDSSSVKSMSPERQKSKSPSREDDVVSPAFSNEDSNDTCKQRRKRKLEKPVRLSKDSKTEVEDMELEPTEPTEPRICEPIREEAVNPDPVQQPAQGLSRTADSQPEKSTIETTKERIEERTQENSEEPRNEENQPIRRRRSSEGPTTNQTSSNQRVRRKSSDDATEFSKTSSPKPVNNANPFNEVESELEKMFAGIVETETDVKKEEEKPEIPEMKNEEDHPAVECGENANVPDPTTEVPSVNPTDVSSTVGGVKGTVRKGKKRGQGGKRKISRSSDNIFGSSSITDTPSKEAKKRRISKGAKKQEALKKTKKNAKIDGLKEMTYDSGSNASSIRSRGPVVHVEGPRDSPLSIQVVNAPREEEEEKNKEKRKSVGNGNAGRSKRLSHQNDLDYRGKVNRAGLFSSTLSSRYDAHTTDSTWVCVFCKQGPHSVVPGDPSRPHPNLAGPHIAPGTYTVPAGVLSDLFGPYLIGKERLEDGILSADEQEITTEQKKGGKNKRSIRYAGLADQFTAKMCKKKRNSVESNVNAAFTGMTLIPGDEQCWEVWLHEQCAIWATGVYMAGGRVTGLQEAVWDATKSVCDSCGLTGANIGCVKRGCKAVIHYPCALTKGWLLDPNQYIPKCNLHRVT